MPTTYTSLLGLALPATGELAGTWGTTVNDQITSLLDSAIAGTTTINTDADITLTTTTGGANQARQAIILWTANGTVTRNITAPAASKTYVVINASAGTQSIVIRGVGPTAGVTVLKGERVVVAWNGSDFVKVSSFGGTGTFTDLTVTGNTILGDAAGDTITVNGATTFTNVNPTLSAGTANGVLYLNGSKVATSGSALVFDGSNLGVGTATITNKVDVVGVDGQGVQFRTGTRTVGIGQISSEAALYWGSGTALTFFSGLERMRLDSTGLGIGTSSPGQKLDVSGADGVRARVVALAGGTPGLILSSSGNTAYTIKAGNADNSLRIDQDGNDRITLASGGNVGIGTSSPGARADVASTTDGDTIRISFPSAATGTTGGGLQFRAWTNTATLVEQGRIQTICTDGSASYGAAMRFMTAGGGSLAERMRLDSAGNLLVGNTSNYGVSETNTLQVKGAMVLAANNTGSASNRNWAIQTNSAAAGALSFAYSSTNTGWPNAAFAMILDSAGNLGLGVPPNAWSGGGLRGFNIGTAGALLGSGGSAELIFNGFYNGTNNIYITSNTAAKYSIIGNVHSWHTAPSGTAGNTISFTQAMTLDASGNLLLNTTATATAKQVIQTGTGNGLDFFRSDTNANFGAIRFRDTTNANTNAQIGWNANELRLDGTNIVSLVTGGNERARITSGGDLAVGNTAAYNNSIISSYPGTSRNGLGVSVDSTVAGTYTGVYINRTASDGNYLVFDRGATRIGTIDVAGTSLVITTNNTERARITAAGNVVAGGSIALATNATDGFLYVPTCAGTPTGTPTAITGMAPIVVNTTNNKLYFYSGGAWRDAGP